MQEFMPSVFTSSRLMILDFAQIPENTPKQANIQKYFEMTTEQGMNPRLPELRQQFNNSLLDFYQIHYLVSRYGEDRSSMLAGTNIAKQGRTLHMGIDIFSRDLENVYAPCDGEIIRINYEKQDHGYGYYLIFKPDNHDIYFFFGHLSEVFPFEKGRAKIGQHIARLGDFINNENGGWSRHLHLQAIKELPPEGKTPIGYSTKDDFDLNSQKFPDPMRFFPKWKIK